MSYFVKKKSVSIGKLEMQKFILGLEIFDVSEKKKEFELATDLQEMVTSRYII